jgi:hypothetical protein
LRKILGRVSNPCSFDTDPDPALGWIPIRIRAQSGSGSNPDPGFRWPKIEKKN